VYSEQSIQRVREAVVADIAGTRLKMKRAGSKWSACCPFHDEKSPSFTVDTAKNIWKCFGCNKGGDAIAFVMEYEHVDFIKAVEIIAEETGVTLEVVNDKYSPEQRQEMKDEKTAMYDLMEWACKYYEMELDEPVMAILTNRGVTEADVKKWRIGYASDSRRAITNMVSTQGKLPMAVKLDLVKEKNEPNGDVQYYDTFRNRIMLPIMDEQGRVIGFGAYACKDLGYAEEELKKWKYINSADTPLYTKSEALYGINHAKASIIKGKKAGMTEGYFDVISAHRANMSHVVASCGTAMTDAHLKKLAKWSIEQVELLQDNDNAGMKARMKSVDMVLENNMLPMVGLWDDKYKDLDDVITKGGNDE